MKEYRKTSTLLTAVTLFLLFITTNQLMVLANEDPSDTGVQKWMEINHLHGLGYKGDGVTIAIIDTGCIYHDDLNSTYETELTQYCEVDSEGSISRTTLWSSPIVGESTNETI